MAVFPFEIRSEIRAASKRARRAEEQQECIDAEPCLFPFASDICSVCHKTFEELTQEKCNVVTLGGCTHSFCQSCIVKDHHVRSTTGESKCPLCRTPYSLDTRDDDDDSLVKLFVKIDRDDFIGAFVEVCPGIGNDLKIKANSATTRFCTFASYIGPGLSPGLKAELIVPTNETIFATLGLLESEGDDIHSSETVELFFCNDNGNLHIYGDKVTATLFQMKPALTIPRRGRGRV